MSNIKAFPLIITLFLIVIIFTGLNLVGDEITENSNIDDKSILLIASLNDEFDANFNGSDLVLGQGNLTNENNPDDPTAFALEFLASQEEKGQFEGFFNKVTSIPSLLILGINDDIPSKDLNVFLIIINALLIILVVAVGFVMVFGDGRIT